MALLFGTDSFAAFCIRKTFVSTDWLNFVSHCHVYKKDLSDVLLVLLCDCSFNATSRYFGTSIYSIRSKLHRDEKVFTFLTCDSSAAQEDLRVSRDGRKFCDLWPNTSSSNKRLSKKDQRFCPVLPHLGSFLRLTLNFLPWDLNPPLMVARSTLHYNMNFRHREAGRWSRRPQSSLLLPAAAQGLF